MLFLISILSLSFANPTQTNEAKNMIKQMAGCYEISFHFKEVITTDNSVGPSDDYHTKALEWVTLDHESDSEVHLQHILIYRQTKLIKHWRQEWSLGTEEKLAFLGDNQWRRISSDPSKWLQRVYHVDDSPRYECEANWDMRAKSWTCAAYRPLPRREYSQRDDYNILSGINTHIIKEGMWFHQQHNEKLLVRDSNSMSFGQEQGLNIYQKVDDSRCELAKNWWAENKGVWHDIQTTWKSVYKDNEVLRVKKEMDGEPLWQKLKELAADTVGTDYEQNDFMRAVRSLIDSYLMNE